jgi:hypothetical protein
MPILLDILKEDSDDARTVSHYQGGREAEIKRRITAIKPQEFEYVTAAEIAGSGMSNESRFGHFITQETAFGAQISFYEQRTAYHVPDRHKTVARLDRGKLFPIISAASGWRTDFAVQDALENRLWRDNVLELCHLMGYNLPPHDRDEPGRPGSYSASHAEKKLIAYYIRGHMILLANLLEGLTTQGSGTWMREELESQHLAPLAPRIPRVQADIRASRAICSDCESFVSHINGVLGIHFTVEYC